jgi:hypothetical protein
VDSVVFGTMSCVGSGWTGDSLVWMLLLLCFDDALPFVGVSFSFDGQIRCLLGCVTGNEAKMVRCLVRAGNVLYDSRA